jgi:hypothetical protein
MEVSEGGFDNMIGEECMKRWCVKKGNKRWKGCGKIK